MQAVLESLSPPLKLIMGVFFGRVSKLCLYFLQCLLEWGSRSKHAAGGDSVEEPLT